MRPRPCPALENEKARRSLGGPPNLGSFRCVLGSLFGWLLACPLGWLGPGVVLLAGAHPELHGLHSLGPGLGRVPARERSPLLVAPSLPVLVRRQAVGLQVLLGQGLERPTALQADDGLPPDGPLGVDGRLLPCRLCLALGQPHQAVADCLDHLAGLVGGHGPDPGLRLHDPHRLLDVIHEHLLVFAWVPRRRLYPALGVSYTPKGCEWAH